MSFLYSMLGECTLKEPFAVRHQDMHSLRRHFHLIFFSVVISDPNSKKNTGGPFWNPLVPLKTKHKPANTAKSSKTRSQHGTILQFWKFRTRNTSTNKLILGIENEFWRIYRCLPLIVLFLTERAGSKKVPLYFF